MLTLQERADAYAAAFPQFPASHFRVVRERSGDCLYAHWLLGNDYKAKAGYYGEYPPGYLDRVLALFPDAVGDPAARPIEQPILHVFAGSVPKGPWLRVDVNPHLAPDLVASVTDLPTLLVRKYPVVLADPPYTPQDAKKYGTPMIDRKKVMRTLYEVTPPGGLLVWLDTVWPMFRLEHWRTAGRICVIRSTNHRIRLASIFERQP